MRTHVRADGVECDAFFRKILAVGADEACHPTEGHCEQIQKLVSGHA